MDPPSSSSLSSTSAELLALQEALQIPKNATLSGNESTTLSSLPPSSSSSDGITTTTTNDYSRAYLSTGGGTNPTIDIGPSTLAIHHKKHNFLLVGRQAATADLRIDHKSISRKHAILYYILQNDDKNETETDKNDSSLGGGGQLRLMIRDLETKKNTRVNGLIIPYTQPTELQHHDTIQFGHAQPIFQVEWETPPPPTSTTTTALPSSTTARKTKNNHNGVNENEDEDRKLPAIETNSKEITIVMTSNPTSSSLPDEKDDDNDKVSVVVEEPVVGAGLTGRAKREAEIAAMMASLEATPTYQKFSLQASDIPKTSKLSSSSTTTNRDDSSTTTAATTTTTQQQQNYDVVTAQQYKLPLHDSVSIHHHGIELESASTASPSLSSSITCLGIDPSGARFVVGSNDGTLRFYDFGGLNLIRPMPFTTITVQDGYRIVDVCYSPNGDRLLVATGSTQPKLLDREGNELLQFVRGDVYVTDPTKTVGHTSSVTCVAWHPLEKHKVITGSTDGSIRIWDVEKGKLQFSMLTCSQTILIKSVVTNLKTTVSTITFAPGGREFVVGTGCGSIQIWNLSKSQLRPQRAIQVPMTNSHSNNNKSTTTHHKGINPNDAIYSVVYNLDGSLLASRTVKSCHVWKAQKLSRSSTPVLSCQNVSLIDETSGGGGSGDQQQQQHSMMEDEGEGDMSLAKAARETIAFSPDGTILCVGCINHQSISSSKQTRLKFYSIPSSLMTSKNNNNNKNGKHDTPILDYPLVLPESPSSSSEPEQQQEQQQDGSFSSSKTPSMMARKDMIVGIQWHTKLNQLLVATTRKSIEILFDAKYSKKGILLVTPGSSRGGGGNNRISTSSTSHRHGRHKGEEELQELYQKRAPPPGSHVRGAIITPNSLPLFRDDTIPGAQMAGGGARKKKRDMVDEDTKQRRPEPPAKGMKAIAGQSAGTSSFTQFIVDATGKNQKQIAGRDPREALFQYKEGKSYIGDAYKGNIEIVLADKTVEQDEDEQKEPKK